MDAIKGTDIYIASHHGRQSGYYSDLFKHFKPYLFIISEGKFCDTSATDRYIQHVKGWTVYKRSENKVTGFDRKCLTTRKDGTIVIKAWEGAENTIMDVSSE